MGYVPTVTAPSRPRLGRVFYRVAALTGLGGLGLVLVLTNVITLAGLPFSVVSRLWQDPIARNAYFGGNDAALHDRIGEMGIETDLKAYYRDRIGNEVVLDQQVHQILYDRTGYLGESYRVNDRGQVVRQDSTQVQISE
ncbi:hypothetical protein C7271_16065 [filamentous cyanobacterium CCP5]|nr:hypothetical protein C7271_16065 [filamentous cyanobacterium CCP5]